MLRLIVPGRHRQSLPLPGPTEGNGSTWPTKSGLLQTGRRLRLLMSSMVFFIEGYDADLRKIHSIPEVRRFYDRIEDEVHRVALQDVAFPEDQRHTFEVVDESGQARRIPFHRVREIVKDVHQRAHRRRRTRGVRKKRRAPLAVLAVKVDSDVLESEVHCPADLNLLWAAGRKCADLVAELRAAGQARASGRKFKAWRRQLKAGERTASQIVSRGGPNKEARV